MGAGHRTGPHRAASLAGSDDLAQLAGDRVEAAPFRRDRATTGAHPAEIKPKRRVEPAAVRL